MKLCIDCKHLVRSETFPENYEYAKCSISGEVSLVSGQRVVQFCSTARRTNQPCGPKGAQFEPNRSPDFRDGRTERYDDRLDTAPDGRALWVEK